MKRIKAKAWINLIKEKSTDIVKRVKRKPQMSTPSRRGGEDENKYIQEGKEILTPVVCNFTYSQR